MKHLTQVTEDIAQVLVIIMILNKQKMIQEHKILATGLHAITINDRVHIYTEEEYQHLSWWKIVKMRYL